MTTDKGEDTRVQVEGLSLHYEASGEGVPALLLHGWPTSSYLWRHTLPVLGRHNKAVAPDLPGFGLSDKPLDVSYSFRFFARVIDGFVDQLALAPLHLVVHDLGGPLGLYWAVHHADKLKSVTLLNTTVFPFDSWAVKLFLAATYVPGLRGILASPMGIERAMRFGLSRRKDIPKAELAPYSAPFQDRRARKALLKTAQNLHPSGFPEIVDGLQRLSCPIRMIYADKDRILPNVANEMKRLKELLPDAEVSSIPGTGHFLQEDNPEPLCEALSEFWREVEGR